MDNYKIDYSVGGLKKTGRKLETKKQQPQNVHKTTVKSFI